MKFGGASVADAAMFRETAHVIQSMGGHRVVVLSAMEGITDELTALVTQPADNAAGRVAAIRDRHITTIHTLLESPHREEALTAVLDICTQLEHLAIGLSLIRESTPRLHDLIVTMGERLSIHILSAYLRQIGVPSIAVEGHTLSLFSDGVFGQATPLFDQMKKPLQSDIFPYLEKKIVPVVTGYYGRSLSGDITTFGRGGSDYVAAILAWALDAKRCEVWKTVEGFMSADPRVVETAKPLERLSYGEASELAFFGAKVLHPRTVVPAQMANIPIYVRNTKNPSYEGTTISAKPAGHGHCHSVVSRKNLAMVTVSAPDIAYSPMLSAVLKALHDHGISVYVVSTSISSLAILIDRPFAGLAKSAIETLPNFTLQSVTIRDSIALIAVVGSDLGVTPGIASHVFTIMTENNINIEMISEGASDVALTFAINQSRADEAVRIIHSQCLETLS